jgi:thioredoxin reductase (NADPH)
MDYEIIIVGGGIAGLTAALTAARAGRRTAIFTGGVPGGELLNIERVDGIPGHEDGIAGFDLCPIAQEQADGAGAVFQMEAVEEISRRGDTWGVRAGGMEHTAPAVVVATGARVRKLGVPREAELAGRGVSHCATCDGPLLRGKIAVVAGGGDSGMQEALTLANFCEKVVIVERSDSLNGQSAYVTAVGQNPKIEVLTGHEVIGLQGAEKLESVRLRDVASSQEGAVDASGLFVFVGLEPNVQFVEHLVDLTLDGRIVVDSALRSSAEGLFAAGNVRSGNGWRAAGAMGDGASAAVAACTYLTNRAWT